MRMLDETGFLQYVSTLQQIIDEVFGKTGVSLIQKLEGIKFPESALLFVRAISTQDHNREIRTNKLGQDLVGRIKAIYDHR